MKKNLCLLSAALLAAGSSAQAQGLLSIGSRDEFERKLPFTLTVGVSAGWDSNVNLSPSDEKDSAYIQGTIRGDYNSGDRRTSYSVGVEYSPFLYMDAPEGTEDFLQDASISFGLRHKVNPRLTLDDNLYFAYEFEPDYNIGASTSRRNSQYLYGYNSFAVTYAWTKRFSTVSSYTISGVSYDDDALSGEDMLSHTFANEFRYALSRTTTAALTYRYAFADYDNGFGDYDSHYILTGLDHSFSRRTYGSFRVGAEIRERDFGGQSTNPYFEGSFTHKVAKQTNLRWYGRLGFEDSDVGNSTERSSFRTGLSVDQRLSSRFAATGGLHYIHDEFDFDGGDDQKDDTIALSLGLDYNVYKNLILNTGYSFTTVSSDNEFREYDRHMFSVGMTARF